MATLSSLTLTTSPPFSASVSLHIKGSRQTYLSPRPRAQLLKLIALLPTVRDLRGSSQGHHSSSVWQGPLPPLWSGGLPRGPQLEERKIWASVKSGEKEVDWPSLGQVSGSGPISYGQRAEPLAWLPTLQGWSLLAEVQVITVGCGH